MTQLTEAQMADCIEAMQSLPASFNPQPREAFIAGYAAGLAAAQGRIQTLEAAISTFHQACVNNHNENGAPTKWGVPYGALNEMFAVLNNSPAPSATEQQATGENNE